MKKTIYLWKKEEYAYPYAGEFLPNITAYLHEDEEERPAILVVPGGGYAVVSPSEGEIVAKKFYDAGYQAFVLTYTTNMFQFAPLEMQPLRDISRAVSCIRKNAGDFHVRGSQISCCGFSAGAHLVGSLAVHYQEEVLQKDLFAGASNRPDAVMLCYPVITSGGKAHRGSFELLFGKEASEEQLEWASLEKHVTRDTPPAFLWQTFTDESVPVDNSILFTKACRQAEVPCELHLFMEGVHGMSVANEDWASNNFGSGCLYTMEQQWQTVKTLHAQNPTMLSEAFTSSAKTETVEEFAAEWSTAIAEYQSPTEQHADASVAQWPSLAVAWLDKIWNMQYEVSWGDLVNMISSWKEPGAVGK